MKTDKDVMTEAEIEADILAASGLIVAPDESTTEEDTTEEESTTEEDNTEVEG